MEGAQVETQEDGGGLKEGKFSLGRTGPGEQRDNTTWRSTAPNRNRGYAEGLHFPTTASPPGPSPR